MRRIVTGHDPNGRSVFTADGEAPRHFVNKAGGYGIGILWSTEDTPSVPVPAGEPATGPNQRYFPAAKGSRFLFVDFLPESATLDAARRGVDPVAGAQACRMVFSVIGARKAGL